MIEFKRLDDKGSEMICYKIRDHLTIHEMMQEFRYFLLALGYHPESIDNYVEAE